jgi:Ala-tRNA(Pro) deacylase
MTSPQQRILNLLEEHQISYKSLHHEPTQTSEESAKVRGVDLSAGGKALVLQVRDAVDDTTSPKFGLFILSASRKLHTKAIKKEFQTKNVRFATKQELAVLTDGLVPGSVPPFGEPVLNLELFVDTSIEFNETIAFNCGSLTDSIIMSVEDYFKIAKPSKVFAFSKAQPTKVFAFSNA